MTFTTFTPSPAVEATYRSSGYLHIPSKVLDNLGLKKEDCRFHVLSYCDDTHRVGIRFRKAIQPGEFTIEQVRNTGDEPSGLVLELYRLLSYHELSRQNRSILLERSEDDPDLIVTNPFPPRSWKQTP